MDTSSSTLSSIPFVDLRGMILSTMYCSLSLDRTTILRVSSLSPWLFGALTSILSGTKVSLMAFWYFANRRVVSSSLKDIVWLGDPGLRGEYHNLKPSECDFSDEPESSYGILRKCILPSMILAYDWKIWDQQLPTFALPQHKQYIIVGEFHIFNLTLTELDCGWLYLFQGTDATFNWQGDSGKLNCLASQRCWAISRALLTRSR